MVAGREVQWFGGPWDGGYIAVPDGTATVELSEQIDNDIHRWVVPVREGRVMWGERREAQTDA